MGGYLRDSVKQQIGICRAVWAVVCGVDAVRGLAPRTCEGGVPALAQGRGEYEFPKASNN